jgi:hypothetical protein
VLADDWLATAANEAAEKKGDDDGVVELARPTVLSDGVFNLKAP